MPANQVMVHTLMACVRHRPDGPSQTYRREVGGKKEKEREKGGAAAEPGVLWTTARASSLPAVPAPKGGACNGGGADAANSLSQSEPASRCTK